MKGELEGNAALVEILETLAAKSRIAYAKWEINQDENGEAAERILVAEAHAQITNLIADIIGEDEAPGTAWDGNAGVRNNLRYKQRRRLEGR